MANLQTETISNGTISVNGTVIYGGFSEFTFGGVKAKFSDNMALGMVGTASTFDGFEPMEASLKIMHYNSNIATYFGDTTKSIQLMVRTNKDHYTSAGRVAQVPLVYKLTATPKTVPGITLKAQEKAEFELEFTVSAVTVEENRVEIFHLDVYANEYRVGGVDKLAQFRSNLGI